MLDVDLNVAPPVEIRDEDVLPTYEIQAAAQTGGLTLHPAIDVETLDDDIMISSPTAFEEVYYKLYLYCSLVFLF